MKPAVKNFPDADIAVMAAAVADYTPVAAIEGKNKEKFRYDYAGT